MTRYAVTIILCMAALAGVALAQVKLPGVEPVADPIGHALPCWCPVDVTRVIDADTVVGNIELPFGVLLRNRTLRVDTHDCWESSKRRQSEAAGEITDAEVAKGKQATAEFIEMLNKGTLYVKPGIRERDNYGRDLGPWKMVIGTREYDMKEVSSNKGWIRKGVK